MTKIVQKRNLNTSFGTVNAGSALAGINNYTSQQGSGMVHNYHQSPLSGTSQTGVDNSLMNPYGGIDRNIMDDLYRHCADASQVSQVMSAWRQVKSQNLNIMITGATGCGKSSTINALFNIGSAHVNEVAKVGVGVAPETMGIQMYEIGSMTLWDTPGLGDGCEADRQHARRIIEKLNERDSNGDLLIDLVLVILDGSTRDLGTSYDLINNVIIPNLGENKSQRILVAINQADAAMKGHNWDYENNRPNQILQRFLEDKCQDVRNRIFNGTGVDVMPIYYSAGFKEAGYQQYPPYNLAKLLYFILQHVPREKRIVAAMNINSDRSMWRDNDRDDYGKKIRGSIGEGLKYALTGAGVGAAIGSAFGPIGTAVGGVLGGIVGFFGGLFL